MKRTRVILIVLVITVILAIGTYSLLKETYLCAGITTLVVICGLSMAWKLYFIEYVRSKEKERKDN